MKHFHIVFTLPHQLHPLIRANEALCYNLLFQAASQTILQLGKEKKYLHAQTGLMAVLHTWAPLQICKIPFQTILQILFAHSRF